MGAALGPLASFTLSLGLLIGLVSFIYPWPKVLEAMEVIGYLLCL